MAAEDAARYLAAYEQAIHAIGAASAGRGIEAGPGISVKLSALHPRYARAQRARVTGELLPRLAHLARLAKRYDIGLNIDAEESERLELSLDLLEALCHDEALAGWGRRRLRHPGLSARAPFVVDVVVDMARRTGRRMMVRLVKGAYWDSEIKRAQVEGLDDFPVFTRKVHTDVSYLACARRLLAAQDAVLPQFATHNAQTLAAIHAMAGPDARYEFQCLHGMGEPLYEEVVGPTKLNRACRIYAPVGTHETLLAYLVRRLLENGANSSFVHRIHDPDVPVDALLEDPVAAAEALAPVGRRMTASPHRPRCLGRSGGTPRGSTSRTRTGLRRWPRHWRLAWRRPLRAVPLLGDGAADGEAREVRNPADHRDVVGHVVEADAATVDRAIAQAEATAPGWAAMPPTARAALLDRAAGLMEARMDALIGPDRARGRQVAAQRHRRGAGGGRFPALLRRRRTRVGQGGAARPRRLHLALELPARDLHRPGRGGAGGGQSGAGEAGRGSAPSSAAWPSACCGRPACRPPSCSCCRATARWARGWSPIRASRA